MTRSLGFNDVETGTATAVGIEVHRTLGCGFPEQVYQEAFAIELADRRIPFEREVTLQVRFKGRLLRACYRVDFICFERLLIELKAVAQITSVDHARMISYLKAAGAQRGLILNFGGRTLGMKRLMFSEALHQAVMEADETPATE